MKIVRDFRFRPRSNGSVAMDVATMGATTPEELVFSVHDARAMHKALGQMLKHPDLLAMSEYAWTPSMYAAQTHRVRDPFAQASPERLDIGLDPQSRLVGIAILSPSAPYVHVPLRPDDARLFAEKILQILQLLDPPNGSAQ